ncbi:alpha/beta fold hydrolase [Nonomuraea sp. NPDC005650]|uniref:alpha/beta fold hydrolase n=1 Tax=Nonomuraea sp. NPDC005650 TaxID=3157045 RepID=UPI0033AD3A9A
MPADTESAYRTPQGQQIVRDWCARRLDRWPVSHRRRDLHTSHGQTHLLTAGPASGPRTVVMIPGTSANAATYLPLAEALAAHRPTVIADLPGQPGLSGPERPRADRLTWYGHWLGEVLDATGIDQAIVLGHSLGGAIALACDSPRIAGRVLIAPGGLTRLRLGVATLTATMAWMARPTPKTSGALVRRFLAPGHTPPPDLTEWYTLIARHCRTTLAPPALPAPLLARRRLVPALVATGEHDTFLPPRRLSPAAEALLDTRLRAIPDAGHLVTDEHPETVAALVNELAGLPGLAP